MNCEALPTRSRQEFCVALKAARERKGISLAEITKTTNIPSSLFEGLERANLRYWPGGLFRRSFFRDYAKAIGLDPAEACAEFVRLFPDEEVAEGPSPQAPKTPSPDDANRTEEIRLELDAAWHGPRWSFLSRLLIAAIDAATVILVAVAAAWIANEDRPTAIATAALAYFCLATPLLGESPAKWIIARRRSILDALMAGPAAVAAAWQHGRDAISQVVSSAESGTDQPLEGPDARPWISDARRVGPAPRLRVRFKA